MRDKFIAELYKELVGPRDGSEEVIDSSKNPLDEYVAGVIIPDEYRSQTGPDPDSEITTNEGGFGEDDFSDNTIAGIESTAIDPKSRPKSFGLSFVTKSTEPEFDICIIWARYKKTSKGWVREPHFKVEHISMSETNAIVRVVYEGIDGKLELDVGKLGIQGGEGSSIIMVHFVNRLSVNNQMNNRELAQASIFQPQLRINLKNLGDLSNLHGDKGGSDRILNFLYKKYSILARGYMCSAIWKEINYFSHFDPSITSAMWPDIYYFGEGCKEFTEPHIRSEFLPLFAVPAPSFQPNELYGKVSTLSAASLSEAWKEEDIDKYLSPLISAYGNWVKENKNDASHIVERSVEYKEIIDELVTNQEETLERMKKGIEILKKDKSARLAFCFANMVMQQQYRWQQTKINGGKQGDLIWRPFQLAFFLVNVEPLCNKDSSYRNMVDLLWIPAGGGKTEAYLAVIAFTIALRRLYAIHSNDEKTGDGVAVITRYTLRLLTIQQFRRTLNMVTAAEYLRSIKTKNGYGWRPSDCDIEGDYIYGSTRFSIGMWVGSGVSPNTIDEAVESMSQKNKSPQGKRNDYGDLKSDSAQIIRCPVCNSWLAVPNEGLPGGKEHLLYITVDISNNKINNYVGDEQHIKPPLGADYIKGDIRMIPAQGNEYGTVVMTIYRTGAVLRGDIESLWKKISNVTGWVALSLSPTKPGYFSYTSGLRKNSKIIDFELYCPNPDCDLNRNIKYSEGTYVPQVKETHQQFQDGLFARSIQIPFYGTRVPIPAYTVDEQIYNRCPTIVISTADKIARLAFEPKAAALFGNVDKYNAFYGYYRNEEMADYIPKGLRGLEYNRTIVGGLRPPELIVQDELHLLEGPLGSLFGLYEVVVDGLIGLRGGRPKYIASTATIENAESQVKQLFGKELSQFPPHGLDIDSSFFVSTPSLEDCWNEAKAGRIYMGVCTQGRGSQTSLTRIMARILKTRSDLEDHPDIKYFWTMVGYFNSVRELGNANALYRHDVFEWLNNISGGKIELGIDNTQELSSRINSTDIPQILDKLEAEGNATMPLTKENTDAVFATSMFGTGVDIPHFSLMVVDGQPKTNSQYIQATGRVGREHGGLVITFFKASQPRDLSHYELFPSYHARLHLGVEPVSVSPFSSGTLFRAAGPIAVSFLRNMKNPAVEWYSEDGGVILEKDSWKDTEKFIELIKVRAKQCGLDALVGSEVEKYFKSQIERWNQIAREVNPNSLDFYEYTNKYKNQPSKNVVLGDPIHNKHKELKVVYENALQSLRDIEETTSFSVGDDD